MKNLNLTDNGGYPMAQDDFNWLQQAYTEAIEAMVQVAGSGPYALYGAVVTRALSGGTVYNYSISAGWIVYGGVPYRVPAMGPVAIDESVDIAQLVITVTSLPLTFNNTVVNDVINDATIGIAAAVIGTADSGTAFLWSELVTYAVAVGRVGKDANYSTLVVNTLAANGGVTGNIKYSKDYIANTVHIKSTLTVNDPYNLVASPGFTAYLLGGLPAGYYCGTYMYFVAVASVVDGTPNYLKDDGGTQYIKQINMFVDPAGNVYALLVKPAAGVAIYNFEFNCVLPLD